MIKLNQICYWRFKGDKEYKFGFTSTVEKGLIRMGLYNGDYTHGPIVDPNEIEIK